ncbi:hypothetical protein J7U46_08865 [Pelomonas sp. V22]|uniref:phage/plasmid replication domain-containing protein n=1 Tax=Pelomonas sp. V22 TaxID=2822139 RepID=UPI0024A7FE09|nr:phage/plasmid replication protein [Pelomonas sp. V22]MDI4633155.1 hypothetical protein [Pelomonas sp. V22]
MIDLVDLSLDFALDQAAMANMGLKQPLPPSALYKREVRASTWLSPVKLRIGRNSIRVRFCPAKLFGGWNAVGSDDLREWVRTLAPLILQELGHRVTSRQMYQFRFGRYRLHEVHIAYSFGLPGVDAEEFIGQVGKALAHLHLLEWIHPGVGFRLNPRSRTAEYLVYAKLRESLDQGRKRIAALAAGLPVDQRVLALAAFGHQLNYAAAGPRLEIRLRDQFFARSPFGRGSNWVAATARELYVAKLQALELPAAVRVVPDLGVAEGRLKPAVFSTFLHWAADRDLARIASTTTLARHRKDILDALGFDIRLPAAGVLGSARDIEVGSVLKAGNLLADKFDPDDGDASTWCTTGLPPSNPTRESNG